MPPRRGRGRGRPTQGPTQRSSGGATQAAAQPFPASARGHRRWGTHLATGGNQSANTAQQSQALPDALNALLALVRNEVMSSSGGAQHSVGVGHQLVLGEGSNLGSRMLRSLADDTESVTLVRECRELEEVFGTRFTDMILQAEKGGGPLNRELKKEIMKTDQELRLERCEDRASGVADIARMVEWEGLWDAALDEGPCCIQQMKRLVKTLCHHCFGEDCQCVHREQTQEMITSLANTV